MSKSKTVSDKAVHEKIYKQIKALSTQIAKLSKQVGKCCDCCTKKMSSKRK